jgi:hypothetical protein
MEDGLYRCFSNLEKCPEGQWIKLTEREFGICKARD